MPPARFSTRGKPAFFRISAAIWLRPPDLQCTTMLAVFLCGQFADALGQIAEWDERRADVDDLHLVRLAHIEDEDVFVRVEAALQFLHADLRNAVDQRRVAAVEQRDTKRARGCNRQRVPFLRVLGFDSRGWPSCGVPIEDWPWMCDS